MKFRAYIAIMAALCAPSLTMAQDSYQDTDCEIVVFDVLDDGDVQPRYLTADVIINSIYDQTPGYYDLVDGKKIRGVMCTRIPAMPTLRDMPILKTGIPLSLSDDFDRPDGTLLTLYFKDGKFRYNYAGVDMGSKDTLALDDMMDIFNLQSHDLE